MSGKNAKNIRRTVKGYTSETIDSMQYVLLRKPLKKRIKVALYIIFKKSFDFFSV